MADESMSAMQFCTTPKGDLPHYYYIFRKTDPLGTYMKNVAYSRLGTMLHLDIQKGEEAINKSKFQKNIGRTDECTKRLYIATKGCGQLTPNYTYFAHSWFIYIKLLMRQWLQESIIAGRQRRSTRFFF